ncbi:MAG: DUF3575 domain-containing protein [Rikenellaceae bacterium]|jgi:hypothetical protein|nr:DUF3575 domain-containing protein [Rikenellaceae bacterium]
MRSLHKLLLALSAILVGGASYGQNVPRQIADSSVGSTVRVDLSRQDAGYWAVASGDAQQSETVVLRFRVNSTVLEPGYMDNARTLAIIDRTFADESLPENLDYATIVATASPEGNTAHNEELATGRALAIRNYITSKHPNIDRARIVPFSAGEDWEGLRRMIANDPRTPSRQEALDALDLSLSGDELRARLRGISAGATYRYIAANMLLYLRGGVACMIYLKQEPLVLPGDSVVITEKQTDTVYVDRVRDVERIVEVPSGGRFRLDIRTNLLYDAFLLPTLGLEWRTDNDRFGIKLDGGYSFWGSEHGRVQKIWFANPELRWYLGAEKRFYLGAGGTFSEYNVHKYLIGGSLSDDIGYQGHLWNAGVTAGYRLPLARRLSLDFNLGLGYTSLEYETFRMIDRTRYYGEKNLTKDFWGPTQLGVNLVWTIGNNK